MCAKRRIQVITMGCSKNLVDSERLMYQLSASGFEVLHEDTPGKVSAVVINTCGFIGDAKEESIDMILRCVEAKKAGKIDQVIVMGCLSERYKKDLQKEIPEVDEYFGVTDLQSLVRRLGAEYCSEHLARRIQTTPSHYAYLKIAEGCDRSCAFCAIPGIRGKYQSVFPSDILNEAGMLVESGVKELLLIAQDLTYYGKDLENRAMLPELVESLSQINGIHWIRLHYGYPAGFPSDLLRVMRENEKVCKYLDLPFQHISSKVLKAMHRNIDQDKTLELIQQIREEVPGIVLRTTLLTGFPGETEKDFQLLEDFVHKVRFERLGVFAYSHEENTYAGDHYRDNVPAIEKQRRVDRIMEIQQEISLEHNESMIGSVIETLIDREEGEFWYGRTPFDSPEVDNEVLISKKIAPNLSVGQFYSVKITGASDFELEGQPV
ncbi:MAG: 30S ribosomal protein S12 methylthiotransferase RimO [Bacteroidales bacterium]|nr:30S ribosomal protein S12 methylthiotransferase RimO [Bacteroidales bacterium]